MLIGTLILQCSERHFLKINIICLANHWGLFMRKYCKKPHNLNVLASFEWAQYLPVFLYYCFLLGEFKIHFHSVTPWKKSESGIWLVKCTQLSEVGRNEWNIWAIKKSPGHIKLTAFLQGFILHDWNSLKCYLNSILEWILSIIVAGGKRIDNVHIFTSHSTSCLSLLPTL